MTRQVLLMVGPGVRCGCSRQLFALHVSRGAEGSDLMDLALMVAVRVSNN